MNLNPIGKTESIRYTRRHGRYTGELAPHQPPSVSNLNRTGTDQSTSQQLKGIRTPAEKKVRSLVLPQEEAPEVTHRGTREFSFRSSASPPTGLNCGQIFGLDGGCGPYIPDAQRDAGEAANRRTPPGTPEKIPPLLRGVAPDQGVRGGPPSYG